MLFRNPSLVRALSVLLLVESTTQIIWPVATLALTAGPTSPEATSFEPVDTTDMVNLITGDMTYNIPLLEIPGPEGGYPLSLAYHAGIQPEMEASWVGLGWSLNPGAISRNVNGYADDQLNSSQTVRDYWVGGDRTTYSVGVGVGFDVGAGNRANVSAGLSFSNDTYQGFGVGAYVGAGIGIGGTPIGVAVGGGTDGYGNSYAGVSVSASKGLGKAASEGYSIGASVGLSTNFHSISSNAGAGISVGGEDGSQSLIGASVSSSGGKASVRVGGGSVGIHNGNAGRIQTESTGFNVSVPVAPAVSVELGYNYMRYWSDETSLAAVNGSLYFPANVSSGGNLDNKAFDSYRIFDPEHENVFDKPDPSWHVGGSFPDYDDYNVAAQGLGGSMRPHAFQLALYSRNRKDKDGNQQILNEPIVWTNKNIGFRFDNDFSNAYRQNIGNVNSLNPRDGSYVFDQNPQYGNQDGGAGYDVSNNRLAGSKHIEWYTNSAITNRNAVGFIDTKSKGFVRNQAPPDLIGGFRITNASGVVYHFALPAYAYAENVYTRKRNDSGTFNILSKPSKYAYTWFLTAVTGPDYVDRNADGLVNDGDWGYWMGFDYGKWTSDYRWRNPAQLYNDDVDADLQTYSTGLKEIYYLNSIRTRTHTALFEKSLRADGKGNTKTFNWLKDGGGTYKVLQRDTMVQYGGCGPYDSYCDEGDITEYYLPTTQLKLNRIILLNNEDVPANIENQPKGYIIKEINKSESIISSNTYNYDKQINSFGRAHMGENIIDVGDIDSQGDVLTKKAIRIIKFNYDYSLCKGTINSSDPDGLIYTTDLLSKNMPMQEAISSTGKLTLNSIDFLGVGGKNTMPPTRFHYELDEKDIKKSSISFYNNNLETGVSIIKIESGRYPERGDIVKCYNQEKNFHLVVLGQADGFSNSYFQTRLLENIPSSPITGTYKTVTTKNPPYLRNYHDKWGMFKSDYNTLLYGQIESIANPTTAVSNKSVDVWSLRKITSPLGSVTRIEFEGDEYKKPVLPKPDLICKTELRQRIINGQTIVPLLLTPYTVAQAKNIFKENQVINLNGLKANTIGMCRANGYTEYDKVYTVLKDQPIKIIGIENSRATTGATVNKAMLLVDGFTMGNDLYGAYITIPPNNDTKQGGGIRVKNISLNSNGITHTSEYLYEKRDYSPSGVTSYEPGSVPRIDNTIFRTGGCADPTKDEIDEYKMNYTKSLYQLFSISRHIPAPGVMYAEVSVREKVIRSDGAMAEIPNTATYQFEVFKENMIGHVVNVYDDPYWVVRSSEVSIKDFTSRIGSLRRITRYSGDGRKLSEMVNHYLHDELNDSPYAANSDDGPTGYQARLAPFNYQGVIQEAYADSRRAYTSNGYTRLVTLTKKDIYPTILTSSTTSDFKTGLVSTNQTLAYDFYSGTPTKQLAIDSYGNRILTESVPAYRKYPDMGLRINNFYNKHMLTQQAASYAYQVNSNNMPIGLLAATAQTWSTQVPVIGTDPSQPEQKGLQNGIFRPVVSYSWMPTGTTSNGLTNLSGNTAFVPFDFSPNATIAAPWTKINEVTLYNPFSNALEAKDIYNTFLTTKMGFNDSKVLISGGPAKYEELIYCGAEDGLLPSKRFSGGVQPYWPSWDPWGASVYTDALRTTGKTHTGIRSLCLQPQKNGFVYEPNLASLDRRKPYRLSVWSTSPQVGLYYYYEDNSGTTVNGTASQKAGDWYLINLTIPPIGTSHTSLRLGCWNGTSQPVYLDDLRFQPANAQAASYVYDQLTGQVTDIIDNDNLFTHYDYDAAGKLQRVTRETFQYGPKPVAENSYSYAYATAALDQIALQAPPAGYPQAHTFQATLTLPSALINNCSVTYNAGTSNGTLTPSSASVSIPCAYDFAGTYWIKVTVQDLLGNRRELARKVTVE